jgi:hypothetical protein
MNKNANILFFTGCTVAAIYLLRNASDFGKTYSARVGSVKYNDRLTRQSLFFKIFLDVNLILRNPSSFTGTVRGLNLNVLFGGRNIATVQQNTSIQVPRQTDTVIPVNVGVSTLTLFPSVNEAILAIKNRKPIQITVAGTVLTNYGSIDVNNVSSIQF